MNRARTVLCGGHPVIGCPYRDKPRARRCNRTKVIVGPPAYAVDPTTLFLLVMWYRSAAVPCSPGILPRLHPFAHCASRHLHITVRNRTCRAHMRSIRATVWRPSFSPALRARRHGQRLLPHPDLASVGHRERRPSRFTEGHRVAAHSVLDGRCDVMGGSTATRTRAAPAALDAALAFDRRQTGRPLRAPAFATVGWSAAALVPGHGRGATVDAGGRWAVSEIASSAIAETW